MTEAERMGEVCPYCGYEPKYYSESSFLYGKDYGPVVKCRHCVDSHVGVHRGSTYPKGRLASKASRELKIKAHNQFDPLWKKGCFKSRSKAYKWLRQELDLPKAFSHIGMLSDEECRILIKKCRWQRVNGSPENTS